MPAADCGMDITIVRYPILKENKLMVGFNSFQGSIDIEVLQEFEMNCKAKKYLFFIL
jgi:hypothetical protein